MNYINIKKLYQIVKAKIPRKNEIQNNTKPLDKKRCEKELNVVVTHMSLQGICSTIIWLIRPYIDICKRQRCKERVVWHKGTTFSTQNSRNDYVLTARFWVDSYSKVHMYTATNQSLEKNVFPKTLCNIICLCICSMAKQTMEFKASQYY